MILKKKCNIHQKKGLKAKLNVLTSLRFFKMIDSFIYLVGKFIQNNIRIFLIFIVFFSCFYVSNLCSYEVLFEGTQDSELLELVRSSSQLEKLKETPPSTFLGLKRRAEEDIENMTLALHSQARYNAKIVFQIESPDRIIVSIDPGPTYPFKVFKVRYFQYGEEVSDEFLSCPIDLADLGIEIGSPALPETILSAEDSILEHLKKQGYAFSSIKKRDVFADQEAKEVIVWLGVETGPLTFFGPLTLKGRDRVNENYFYKKLKWMEGDQYSPEMIEKTQEALEMSGLFKSVNISYPDEPGEGHLLPIELTVSEAKQRSVGFGLNFMTSWGLGFTGEWEDRNFRGEGQTLSARADIWQNLQEGSISYLIPEFQREDQNLIWTLDWQHERTKSFTENAFSISGIIDRKLNDRLKFSYGGMFKRLRSERSDFNGTFNLFKTPLQLRWSNIDSILDPSSGATFQLKVEPSLQVTEPYFAYVINTFTGTFYQSLTKDKRHIFAAKLTAGTIFGASENEIPPPERFYAGSESTLRGYRYKTVSPIGRDHKPLGGRSILVYTLELRNRISENFGLVLFYDIGNVYKSYYPDFKEGFRQSTGLGIRYYTPIGPLRLDLAFPLNKRKHIDNSLEAYFSIGQSF